MRLQKSNYLIGDPREVFLGSKLSVLTLQETFLVLVFKTGTNSVSKCVSVEVFRGRKKAVVIKAGRLFIFRMGCRLCWGLWSW